MKSLKLAAGLGLLVASFAIDALGQASSPRVIQPPAPPAPPAAVQPAAPAPDRTTASFGDWTLRCDRRADMTPPQRFCEIGQIVQRAGDAGPQAQFALGRVAAGEPLRLTVLVPVNVTFAGGAKLVGDSSTTLDLVWLRCIPAGCFANAVVADDLFRKLKILKESGRVEYKDAVGRDISVPVSFRGFPEATEAFLQESSN